MQASSPATKSKSSLWILLLLGAMVAWASLETCRLWVATQQVAASQQLELRVSAKLEAARAKHAHFANAEESARAAGASQK
jgi:flagellar basal body-associated protein FliL